MHPLQFILLQLEKADREPSPQRLFKASISLVSLSKPVTPCVWSLLLRSTKFGCCSSVRPFLWILMLISSNWTWQLKLRWLSRGIMGFNCNLHWYSLLSTALMFVLLMEVVDCRSFCLNVLPPSVALVLETCQF